VRNRRRDDADRALSAAIRARLASLEKDHRGGFALEELESAVQERAKTWTALESRQRARARGLRKDLTKRCKLVQPTSGCERVGE
jgi:hypothetical protein